MVDRLEWDGVAGSRLERERAELEGMEILLPCWKVEVAGG